MNLSDIQERAEPLKEKVGTLGPRKGSITYRDSPILKQILLELQDLEEDKESLLYAYKSYAFVASIYARMGRISLSADNLLCALNSALKLKRLYNEDLSDIKSNIIITIRNRNYYVEDDCESFKPLVIELVGEEKAKELYEEGLKQIEDIKYDPVEMTPEYLAVIDEIEEKIEALKIPNVRGTCFQAWAYKARLLAEKGITWKSPSAMNPYVLFD